MGGFIDSPLILLALPVGFVVAAGWYYLLLRLFGLWRR